MEESDEESKVVKKLEERKDHLQEVKRIYLKAQEAIPFVQQSLDLTDWELRAHKDRPPESTEIPTPSSPDQLEQGNQFLKGVFPILHVPDTQLLFSGTATTTSTSSQTFTYVGRIRDLGTPASVEYGDKYIDEYRKLQDSQDRPRQVRSLLGKLGKPKALQRFDHAFASHAGFRAGAEKRTAAANEIRNLLNGFKGDLWNLARRSPKENMSWQSMSARLALNGGSGREHVVLNAEATKHRSLLARLADVLKDREGGSITNLDSIWTEVLDHLYTVLGLIRS